jgi:hypothetical protein
MRLRRSGGSKLPTAKQGEPGGIVGNKRDRGSAGGGEGKRREKEEWCG